jgi:glutathione synthase/RimK-type ligase-like ATP-grasp enzyme
MLTFDLTVDPVEKFAAREHLSAFIGTLLNVSPRRWINFPWAESTSDGKIYPLMVASKIGIPIPPFLISSLSKDLIEFDQEYGPCVIKPMSDMSIARQNGRFVEVPDLADFSAPYTNNFSAESLVIEEVEERTPTLIQKKIEKLGDVRVVVIDGQMFSSFLKKEDNLVDSRLTKDRDESIYDIHDELRSKITHLVFDILSLRFAALDFVHGIDDRLYLVDVNPSGNWLWQEQFLGLPISSAISDSLMGLPPLVHF